ncbi:hypothetical protein [Rubritalea marina]|uniref:hypothetical protein n=1 Tax=Rubritalea marina TaxID=361055 RepID=UPI00037FA29D|nr:hypothetical protein [Rubritalea marina]
MKTLEFTPQWSRILHRLHGLGAVDTQFKNPLACLTESGEYPRYIASASEDHSQSADGSINWNFGNWSQGLVRNAGTVSEAEIEILFRSHSSFCFHSIHIKHILHNDCLNCLLQLFAKKGPEFSIVDTEPLNPLNQASAQSLERVAELIANKRRGFQIEMLTEGGMIRKQLHAENVTMMRDQVHIQCHKQKHLKLVAQPNSQIITKHTGTAIHSTIYDARNIPQIHFKIPA